jgi:LuxR family transcriptional regulator
LSRIFTTQQVEQIQPNLTAREIEVLKWTADGKTSADISSLLAVSENTVNFHVKNAVFKLQSTNKTAATVRAAMLGLLM